MKTIKELEADYRKPDCIAHKIEVGIQVDILKDVVEVIKEMHWFPDKKELIERIEGKS